MEHDLVAGTLQHSARHGADERRWASLVFSLFERGELFSEIQVVCVKFLVFDVRIRIERTIFVKIICTCCLLFKDKRQYSLLIIMKFI